MMVCRFENQQWGQDHAPNVDLNAFEEHSID